VAATFVVLIILVGWGISTVLIARERNAAQAAAVEAKKERKRAEENLLKAKQAVDTWFTQVAADLEGKPHMTNVQGALLEQALEFYKGFLKQKGDDPEIRRETVLACLRVAHIYTLLGRDAESAEAAREGVVIIDKLSAERPDDVDLQSLLAESYHVLGARRAWNGESAIAAGATRKAIDIWEKLARRLPSVPHYQSNAAVTLFDLADQLSDIPGKLAEAEARCRESLARWQRFRENFPNVAMTIHEEDLSHLGLASILVKAGRYAEVEQHVRSSIDRRSKFFAENPQDSFARVMLTKAKSSLAEELLRKGAFEESEKEFKSCVELLQLLVDQYPDVEDYRTELRSAYAGLSLALFSQRRYAEAERAARESCALLPSEDDATLDGLKDIAWTHYDLGLIVHRQDRIQEAADLFRKAIGQFERVAAESPQDRYSHRRAQNRLHWSLATCPLSQFRDAQRALKIAKWFAQREPLRGECWTNMGIAHYRMGSFDQAIDAIRKSIELRGEGDSYDFYFLAMALWQRGDKEEARTWYQKAVDHKENPGGSNNPDLLNFRDEAEQLLGIPKAAPAPPDAPQGDPAKPES
jgi:tetratricopeptide (TPR) repeat protein